MVSLPEELALRAVQVSPLELLVEQVLELVVQRQEQGLAGQRARVLELLPVWPQGLPVAL